SRRPRMLVCASISIVKTNSFIYVYRVFGECVVWVKQLNFAFRKKIVKKPGKIAAATEIIAFIKQLSKNFQ
ncbi:MAG: hypothetical protein ABID61_03670, partial [Candidatus Micrarchaeota archaeon]